MPEFLVETYMPQRPVDVVAPVGDGVHLVRSLFVPEDEICLHVFAGPSVDAVRDALDGAAFAYQRIVEAMAFPADI